MQVKRAGRGWRAGLTPEHAWIMFHLDESISAASAGCPLDQSRENINAYRHSFF
jgi:hypothetical protein